MTAFQPALPPTTAAPPEPPWIDHHFNEALANQLAELETYNKHLYRPNSYLHKWWARRCGSTFRLILKALVDEGWQRDYYAPGGLEGQTILDPMLGGGTTLHEAIRLGARVVGADIDPIPILQARASLAHISLHVDLEPAFARFYADLQAELNPYFITPCPTCGQPARLRYLLYGAQRQGPTGPVVCLDSLTLRRESDGTVYALCPETQALLRNGAPIEQPTRLLPPLVAGRRAHRHYQADPAAPFYTRFAPAAVVGQCGTHGRFLKLPGAEDWARLEEANGARPMMGDSADFAINPGPKSQHLIRQGVRHYTDLFSSRQLLFLETVGRLLPAYELPIRLNLALLVSTALEFNSMLCGYKGMVSRRPGAIRHAFAYHAYTFPCTVVENNPLFPGHKASGTLTNLFHQRIRRARAWAALPLEREIGRKSWRPIHGEVDMGPEVTHPAQLLQAPPRTFCLQQASAARLDLPDASIDHIVTDPPYYDSVHYSDMAAFFRVWLARWLPGAVDWRYDITHAAVEHAANGQYESRLTDIFRECRRVLRPERGRLIFTFHHGRPEAWAALTLALKRAGFVLLNRYVVYAENPISVHIANLNAITHDVILVLGIGRKPAPLWTPPAAINTSDSAAFCRDCGTLLGWQLTTPLSDAAIRAAWRDHLT